MPTAGSSATRSSGPEEMDAFNLFCAYHLGVTRDNRFKFQSVGEVARRFGVEVDVVKRKLYEFGIDSESLRELGFNAEYAQLDIKVAPEGVSRRELGRTIWAEFEDQITPRPPEEPEEPEEEMVADSADDSDEGDDVDEGDIADASDDAEPVEEPAAATV